MLIVPIVVAFKVISSDIIMCWQIHFVYDNKKKGIFEKNIFHEIN